MHFLNAPAITIEQCCYTYYGFVETNSRNKWEIKKEGRDANQAGDIDVLCQRDRTKEVQIQF